MAAPTFSPAQIEAFVVSLEGAELARIVTILFFCLTIYEYLITLDQEIEYFWAGAWTSSRILFFLNRYLSPMISVVTIMCFSPSNPSKQVSIDTLLTVNFTYSSLQFCTKTIQAAFLLNITGICIIQGIHVVRVWYIFCDSRRIRILILGGFVTSIITSLYFIYITAQGVDILTYPTTLHLIGCHVARPQHFWRSFFPSLILHTFLYILTAYRALRNRRIFKQAPVMKRLVRDGGLFYFVVFFSVGFASVGSFLHDPRINIPATLSSFLLASTSIATSRLLFSIHSLAAHVGSDSAWLLNNAELSRVGWKQGAHEGEIIIERFSADDDDDEESAKSVRSIKMSRVGVFEW
ncbi:hypothetical protein BD779DRAFT_1667052 [Infundibulicybe gibba]|nr:hypothetical protein BD779DRAFT_1667052 [Infundibulicybe gibba]